MRREFSKKTKAQAFERSGGHCDECTAKLRTGSVHYDHRIPDAMGGEPVLANCQVLCTTCHGIKTRTQDVPTIAKAKRVHARHIGATTSRNPLPAGRRSKWKKKISGEVVLR